LQEKWWAQVDSNHRQLASETNVCMSHSGPVITCSGSRASPPLQRGPRIDGVEPSNRAGNGAGRNRTDHTRLVAGIANVPFRECRPLFSHGTTLVHRLTPEGRLVLLPRNGGGDRDRTCQCHRARVVSPHCDLAPISKWRADNENRTRA
jgi:hypothetical protein